MYVQNPILRRTEFRAIQHFNIRIPHIHKSTAKHSFQQTKKRKAEHLLRTTYKIHHFLSNKKENIICLQTTTQK